MSSTGEALARWAGDDEEARALARRGAALLGAKGWAEGYAEDPARWLVAVDGQRLLARWRRAWGRLSGEATRWACRAAGVRHGLNTAVLLGLAPRATEALEELVTGGWLEAREGRLAMTEARRHVVWAMFAPERARTEATRWGLGYLRRALTTLERWAAEDRAHVADALRDEALAARLSAEEVERAAAVLRHSLDAAVGAEALRRRLVHAAPEERAALRRGLGLAMLDVGAFGEATPLLRGRSRESAALRAHAMIRGGNPEAGMALLRRIGPRRGDREWRAQWVLGAMALGRREVPELLARELETCHGARARGVVLSFHGEWAEGRDTEAARWYRRAIEALEDAGDDIGVAWCRARLARELARRRDDEGAEQALLAWTAAATIPGSVVRGMAALACVETRLLAVDDLRGVLEQAAQAELPALAAEAQRCLRPEARAPIVSLGRTQIRFEGVAIALTQNGPPWRVLAHLASLGSEATASIDELFAAGWPGERAAAPSRRRRVHTAIWTLRRAGLRPVLETVGRHHYRLRARVINAGV